MTTEECCIQIRPWRYQTEAEGSAHRIQDILNGPEFGVYTLTVKLIRCLHARGRL